ncbi:uncharacterized protein BXZ73DRAFT_76474 [Epithele typhae]|uniref:uncharacterized protein n=1 Tax=Epithele typhae TaxID=378194 RepID=UPI00200853ED|nr:uncharacterized protein BXZ73DRAFT_76474 [Epithele typhae]KAH9937839.1 hypothetical protein BXZ73DRAFT_76474 [Epithele typhae]
MGNNWYNLPFLSEPVSPSGATCTCIMDPFPECRRLDPVAPSTPPPAPPFRFRLWIVNHLTMLWLAPNTNTTIKSAPRAEQGFKDIVNASSTSTPVTLPLRQAPAPQRDLRSDPASPAGSRAPRRLGGRGLPERRQQWHAAATARRARPRDRPRPARLRGGFLSCKQRDTDASLAEQAFERARKGEGKAFGRRTSRAGCV